MKGFTLIELMIVVTIIFILGTLAVGVVTEAKETNGITTVIEQENELEGVPKSDY